MKNRVAKAAKTTPGVIRFKSEMDAVLQRMKSNEVHLKNLTPYEQERLLDLALLMHEDRSKGIHRRVLLLALTEEEFSVVAIAAGFRANGDLAEYVRGTAVNMASTDVSDLAHDINKGTKRIEVVEVNP
jgi:hypothetical protein